LFRRYRKSAFRLAGCAFSGGEIAANGQLDSALGRLLVIVENYPQLKSNENFLRLQDELAGTENRIAWNGGVTTRRCKITTPSSQFFPNSLVASLSGFARNDAYFKNGRGRTAGTQREVRLWQQARDNRVPHLPRRRQNHDAALRKPPRNDGGSSKRTAHSESCCRFPKRFLQ